MGSDITHYSAFSSVIKTLDNFKKNENNSLVSFQVANVFCTVWVLLGV